MLLPIIVPILSVALGLVPVVGGRLNIGFDSMGQTAPDIGTPAVGEDGSSLHIDDDQRSGIYGTVYSIGGNHMPAPNRRRPDTAGLNLHGMDSAALKSSTIPGVRATVCIFRLTSDSQVVHVDPTHYRAILTPLISQIETDEKGHFQVFLPPGTYSVLTKKGELFYASRRDEKNHIAPVEVLPGKMTQVSCSVESDHKAVY